ncbi:MAG TPA: PilW family protein [Burkholderiales bacterium]|nr:PilW family protein [Burkholderiales bacterium]
MMKRSMQHGFSLVEMMIAMTIGLMITAGLVTIFANTSNSQQEMRRASQQIENGRYAMDVLSQDLQVTGYYGSFRKITAPATAPDPCSLLLTDLQGSINLPVQVYNAASLAATPSLPASCSAYLPASNLSPGSDIVVVRRGDTQYVAIGTATPAGQVYGQANPSTIDIHLGGGTTTCTSRADGAAATVTRRLQYPATTDICNGTASPAGYIRQYHVHVYFVAPCTIPSTGTLCDSAADGGNPIPTLKRLELTATGGVTAFKTTNISEGVEFLKLAYGIDDTPNTVNSDTGLIGDGSPDRYSLAPSLVDMSNIVTARIDMLVRNPEPSAGFTDTKTYALGVDPVVNTNPSVTIPATILNQAYRRHVYSAEIRLVNLSSRKEIP